MNAQVAPSKDLNSNDQLIAELEKNVASKCQELDLKNFLLAEENARLKAERTVLEHNNAELKKLAQKLREPFNASKSELLDNLTLKVLELSELIETLKEQKEDLEEKFANEMQEKKLQIKDLVYHHKEGLRKKAEEAEKERKNLSDFFLLELNSLKSDLSDLIGRKDWIKKAIATSRLVQKSQSSRTSSWDEKPFGYVAELEQKMILLEDQNATLCKKLVAFSSDPDSDFVESYIAELNHYNLQLDLEKKALVQKLSKALEKTASRESLFQGSPSSSKGKETKKFNERENLRLEQEKRALLQERENFKVEIEKQAKELDETKAALKFAVDNSKIQDSLILSKETKLKVLKRRMQQKEPLEEYMN